MRGQAHSGDLLSAWLDGRLEGDEVGEVAGHVESCPACAAELRSVATARAALRSLPVLDPPFGFYEGLVRRTRRRWAAPSMAASVAASFLVLSLGGPAVERVTPSVGGLAASHAEEVNVAGGGLASLGSTGASLPSTGSPEPLDVEPPFHAPASLAGGYRLVDADWDDGRLHVRYDDGGGSLSLYEEAGRVDWDALPAGQPVAVGDDVGRLFTTADGEVLVWGAGEVVYAAVGDSPEALLSAAAAVGPPRPLSLTQKLRRACRAAVDVLG